MAALISSHQAQGQCIVLLDANATSGQADGVHILETQESENHSTDNFQAFLKATDTCAPSTDPRLGHWQPTWTSPNGQTARRLDYALVPVSHLFRCTQVFTDCGVDLNFCAHGHVLTGLQLTWGSQTCDRQSKPVATQKGLNACTEHSGEHKVLGPVWMDDLAIMVSADSADQLIRKVSKILSELLAVCLEHGMQPNTDAGKTETVLSLRGAGSGAWKKHFFNQGGRPYLDIVTDRGMVQIHVATSYKHLGGLLHHTGHGTREAKQRFAQAHQAFREHRKLLFGNPHFSNQQRLALMDSLVMSKLMYGFETILLPKPKDQADMETALFRLYKRLQRKDPAEHQPKESLLADYELPDFQLLHRRARLRYYATVLRCADLRTWGLLGRDTEWAKAVQDDLQWMRATLLLATPLPDPDVNLEPWHNLMVSRPGYWKKLISRAVRKTILTRKHDHIVLAFHRRLCETLQAHDILPAIGPDLTAPTCAFGCMQCKFQARTKAGEAAHMFRKHGVCAKERWLFDTTQCRNCLKQFHTAAKLQRHLTSSTRCKTRLRRLRHLQAPLPGIGSTQDRQLHRDLDDLLPTLQAEGPGEASEVRHDFQPWDVDLADAIAAQFVFEGAPPPIVELEVRIRQVIGSTPVAWTTCKATLLYLADTLTEEDADHAGHPLPVLRTLLLGITSSETWDFFEDLLTDLPTSTSRPLADWETLLQTFVEDATQPAEPPVPGAFSSHRIVLHLFSGRRRRGDIQDFLERVPPAPGQTIHVISIDLVFHQRWGDLSRWDTQRWWLAQIRAGLVIAMLAGPPCSSWSKARGKLVNGKKYAPRVLRTEQSPWGIPLLAIREILQIIEADILLFFCIEAVLELWVAKGTALLEHPAKPSEAGLASIWKTLPIQLLLSLPGCGLVHLWQGLYGAKSPKPTHMLALNLPSFPQILKEHALSTELPKQQSIGLCHTGGWQTTALKEYPPGLNRALASAFLDFSTRADVCDRPIPKEFWQTTASMVADFGTEMGRDYHG
eukprot:Skav202813  [mRNA]  locus=scaffold326:1091410:1095976:- [translate_table: standard]